jgi:hypothetical protein
MKYINKTNAAGYGGVSVMIASRSYGAENATRPTVEHTPSVK